MIGGATRVPGIKAALTEALGGRQLDTHLDADEAVADRGLFAANMSTTFRMRKFEPADAAAYGFELDAGDPGHPGVRRRSSLGTSFPVRAVSPTPLPSEAHRVPQRLRRASASGRRRGEARGLRHHGRRGGDEETRRRDWEPRVHFAVDNGGILFVDKAGTSWRLSTGSR